MTMDNPLKNEWAIILGASSGFGEATALELARAGMNIIGVHLDRRDTLPNAERIQNDIQSMGQEALFFNMNAANEENRKKVVETAKQKVGGTEQPKFIRVLFHSLAFGTLKPFTNEDETLTPAQMEMTLDVMAHSLIYWTQDLVKENLLGKDSRILAMTSAGSERVFYAYGAVSAAKAALESHIRQLTMELAGNGITINAIRAGITDTPALRKIPGHDEMIRLASEKNPHKRLTTPTDVGKAVSVLVHPNTYWLTGNVLGVDGGEFIVH